jgi:hypothetical protein
MINSKKLTLMFLVCGILTLTPLAMGRDDTQRASANSYEGLVNLFNEFREFVKPNVSNGVPDYRGTAMAEQKRALKCFQERLSRIDVRMCPYGWAEKEGYTIWAHKSNTPFVPGFEMSYTMGKVQLEKLIADRAHQLGRKFNLREFMDEFRSYGMIPFALIRWEMTGFDDEIKKLQEK